MYLHLSLYFLQDNSKFIRQEVDHSDSGQFGEKENHTTTLVQIYSLSEFHHQGNTKLQESIRGHWEYEREYGGGVGGEKDDGK